jgi:hypothetical protein
MGRFKVSEVQGCGIIDFKKMISARHVILNEA